MFGEQTVLTGSQALSVPFNTFKGSWHYGSEVDPALANIIHLLPDDILDIDFFQKEVGKNLFFNSDIPQKGGLGSSGALTAALYKCFSHNIKSTIKEIQQDLAAIESVFHGKSSGTDALVSFANQPILTSKGVSKVVDVNVNECGDCISLIQSYTPRTAKTFIKLYLDKVEAGMLNHQLLSEKSNAALEAFISKEDDFMGLIKELSITQLKEFTDFIPTSFLDFWKKGINSDSYFCKLCGAGGGGYFLCFSKQPLEDTKHILGVNY